MGTNVLPKDPVPPVINIVEFSSIFSPSTECFGSRYIICMWKPSAGFCIHTSVSICW